MSTSPVEASYSVDADYRHSNDLAVTVACDVFLLRRTVATSPLRDSCVCFVGPAVG